MPTEEHLTNSLVMHSNGMELMTMHMVRRAFQVIHLLTGEEPPRPPQVMVNAITGSGPERTRLAMGEPVRRQLCVESGHLAAMHRCREAAFQSIRTNTE